MYEIEFNDEMTLEGILNSFKNLNDINIKCFIEIDGNIIYDDDPKLKQKIEIAYNNYHDRILSNNLIQEISIMNQEENCVEDEAIDELEKEMNELCKIRDDLFWLSLDPIFKFQMGIVLEYTENYYKEDILNYYITAYSKSNKDKEKCILNQNIVYMANLLLIIHDEDSSRIQKQIKIQHIINSIEKDDLERYKFMSAVYKIENYTINGKQINDLLYDDVLSDVLSEKNETLNRMIRF